MKLEGIWNQLWRYVVVGLSLNGIGYLFYLLLTVSLNFNPIRVVAIVYPLSVVLSFLFNRRWTFNHRGRLGRGFLLFISAHLVGYLINLSLLAVFWSWLGFPHTVVQLAAVFIVAACLFVMFRLFVFPEAAFTNVAGQESREAPR